MAIITFRKAGKEVQPEGQTSIRMNLGLDSANRWVNKEIANNSEVFVQPVGNAAVASMQMSEGMGEAADSSGVTLNSTVVGNGGEKIRGRIARPIDKGGFDSHSEGGALREQLDDSVTSLRRAGARQAGKRFNAALNYVSRHGNVSEKDLAEKFGLDHEQAVDVFDVADGAMSG